MSEQEKRLRRCCFTGHRPEKLNQPEEEVIAWLEAEIRKSIDDGFVTFISGMARGVDIWAAEIVLRLRDGGLPIHLICAIPFEGFERSWDAAWKQRYTEVMKKADLVKFVSKSYSRACYQIRNEWMVDRSSRVIVVYNGQAGGTKNTIKYAQLHRIRVVCSESIKHSLSFFERPYWVRIMADHISPQKRSWNMAQINGKGTKPEELVRKYLFSQGFRYRKNVRDLPGCPDIVLPKYNTVVFVNGCFWHKHDCPRFVWPSSNKEYWIPKIERNVARDLKNQETLKGLGWKVLIVWECQLKKKTLDSTLNQLVTKIRIE